MSTPITNATELQNINLAPAGDYILMNDIDLTGVPWTPIGSGAAPFSGTFDGQEFTISNLTVTDDAVGAAGLFGYVGDDGTVKNGEIRNLNLENITLTGNYAMGGLFGFLIGGTIENVHIVNVVANWDNNFTFESVGGLGGDCYNISGLVSTIYNCDVDGFTCPNANNNVGGLLGDCYVGSVATDFIIHKVFAKNVNITLDKQGADTAKTVGGLIGTCSATVYDYYVEGEINSEVTDTEPTAVGGAFGECDSPFNIYNGRTALVLNLSGQTCTSIAGLIGLILSPGASILKNCYPTGQVTATGTRIAGLVGDMNNALTTFENCSWYTAIASNAIGRNAAGSVQATLVAGSNGTDEPDNTTFYETTHVVYDQGNADEWDFATPIWLTECHDYPTFVGSICPDDSQPINFYSRGDAQPINFYSRGDTLPINFYSI